MKQNMTRAQRLHQAGERAFETSPNVRNGEVSIPSMPSKCSAESHVLATGTPHAINYYNIGGPAHLPPDRGRGGARNRADRTSDTLSIAQVANLTEATTYACVIGLPFTRMITIHWEAAGVPLAFMAKATGRFIDLMSKALARHGSTTAWIWVHENGPAKGGHCHLLAHVPAALVKVLTSLQRGWLKRITGRRYRARVIRSRPIGGWLGIENSNPSLHVQNLHVALRYVLKQASAKAASLFELERREPGGLVIGKRCGTSQNIGPSARKKEPA